MRGFLCVLLMLLLSSLCPYRASAQSISEVLADVQAHSLQGISCRSVVIAFQIKDTAITSLITGWIDGYVQGVGAALLMTKADARALFTAEEAKSPTENELGLHLAAMLVSAFSGNPSIVTRASIATRQSELNDYCRQHQTESLQAAAGSLLNDTWLKLPPLKAQ